LRNEENAQFEIRQYAKDVEILFADKMPATYEAWIKNGRIAP